MYFRCRDIHNGHAWYRPGMTDHNYARADRAPLLNPVVRVEDIAKQLGGIQKQKEKKSKVTLVHSIQIRCLYQQCGWKGPQLVEKFKKFGYKRATIYEHAKRPIAEEAVFDKRKTNKGRPRLLSPTDGNAVTLAVKRLRESDGSFVSSRIQDVSATVNVSNRTVRRELNRQGYKYTRTRRKGVLRRPDLKKRMQFCRKVKDEKLGLHFWMRGIAFYMDGVGFEYKRAPKEAARTPSAMEWMKEGETLNFGCTAKGKKEGVNNANFMVGIAPGRGVVLCEQYFGTITGAKMAAIATVALEDAYSKCTLPCSRTILQDNCTRQNSAAAMVAFARHRTLIFPIPARSPDLNPIENFFNLVKRMLKLQARVGNIQEETFDEFSARCSSTMKAYPADKIDDIIKSMPKRINMVLKAKGQRIKY